MDKRIVKRSTNSIARRIRRAHLQIQWLEKMKRIKDVPYSVSRIDPSCIPEVKSWANIIGDSPGSAKPNFRGRTITIPLDRVERKVEITLDGLLSRIRGKYDIMQPICPGIRQPRELLDYGKIKNSVTKFVPESFKVLDDNSRRVLANKALTIFANQELEYGLVELNKDVSDGDTLELTCDMDLL